MSTSDGFFKVILFNERTFYLHKVKITTFSLFIYGVSDVGNPTDSLGCSITVIPKFTLNSAETFQKLNFKNNEHKGPRNLLSQFY